MTAPTIGMMMSLTSDCDDGSERRADDDADGKIDHVAAHREFLNSSRMATSVRILIACGGAQPARAASTGQSARSIAGADARFVRT